MTINTTNTLRGDREDLVEHSGLSINIFIGVYIYRLFLSHHFVSSFNSPQTEKTNRENGWRTNIPPVPPRSWVSGLSALTQSHLILRLILEIILSLFYLQKRKVRLEGFCNLPTGT